MRLYLVQHGDALSKQTDPQRPLSEAGRRQVAAMGRLLASAGVRPARVVHSGKRRAQETAELLAAALAPGAAATAMVGLDPKDPVEPLAHALVGWATDTMLVGHLPCLAKLAGRLVTGDEDMAVAAIVPGTVLCLEPASGRRWAIAWMVRPELAPGGT
jgi:phosphohistidine phosphatase